jgi:uncharacterized protein involved in exopolysaccharide biosynthesis
MDNYVGVSLQDYWSVLRRRRFAMSWVFLAVLTLVIAVLVFIPERYRSSAVIFIESPEVKGSLIPTTVQVSSTDLRIDRIRDKVLKTENLVPLIEEFSLYRDVDPEDRPSAMREDIDTPRILDSENGPRQQLTVGETIGFEVAYRHVSPAIAQKVASRLADMFVQENIASRTETVTETSRFLQTQAEVLKAELARTEQALAEFKRLHAGTLPADKQLNEQLLDRTERDLEAVEREMRTLQDRKNLYTTQLARTPKSVTLYGEKGDPILGSDERLELLRREYVTMAARYSPEHPDLVKLRKEIELLSADGTVTAGTEDLQLEIDEKRAELESLRQRYAEDHPDIKRLERTLDGLLEQLKNAPKTPGKLGSGRAPNNPDYLELQTQIGNVDTELVALRRERDEYRERITDYETRLARAPETERELLTLTRDYEIAGHDYDEIRKKQAEAERAIVIEDQQRAERYVLQRDAYLPTSPAQPTHLTLLVMGIFLGLTAAFGTGLLIEAFDNTVRGVRDIRNMFAAPPIAIVPMIENHSDSRHRILRRAALAASFVAVVFIGFMAVA